MSATITSVKYKSGGATPTFKVAWSGYGGQCYLQVNKSGEATPDTNNSSNAASGHNTDMPGSSGTNYWTSTGTMTGKWVSNDQLVNNIAYTMQTVPNYGGTSNCYSNCVPILYNKIKTFSAIFDGTNISVTWTPPKGASQPTQTKICLTNTAGNTQNHTTTNTTQCTFAVNQDVSSGDMTVELQPQWKNSAALSEGPNSHTEPVATEGSNVISTVIWNQTGVQPKFKVNWSQNGSYHSELQVMDNQGSVVDGTTTMSTSWSNYSDLWGSWTGASPLAKEGPHKMLVVQDGDDGCVSNAVPLLYYPDMGIMAAFNGTNVAVSWTPPKGQPQPTQTKIHLHNTLGDQYLVTTNTSQYSFGVKTDMLSGDSWTLRLKPEWDTASGVTGNPLSQGPWSDPEPVMMMQQIVSTAPDVVALQIVSATSNQLTAKVSTPVVPGQEAGISFVAVATWRGTQVSVSDTVDAGSPEHGLYTFNVTLSGQFDAARMYNLCLAPSTGAEGGGEVEGTGVGMDLLLGEPLQAEITVQGSGDDLDVTLAVVPPAGPWMPTGAWTGLYNASGDLVSEAASTGFAHTLTLKAPTPGQAYTASAALERGSDRGVVSQARWPLIISAPSIQKVVMEDASLTATWTPISDKTVTGYLLIATCGGAELARGVFNDVQGCLPIPAGPAWKRDQEVQVHVRGVGDRIIGLASTPTTAVSAAPLALSATYAYGIPNCILSWEPPPGMEGYEYVLQVFQGEAIVAHYKGSDTSFSPKTLTEAGGYRFMVRMVDKDTESRQGPWSLPLPFLTGAPADLEVDYDGRTLTARFSPVPGASGYRLALMNGQTEEGLPWFESGPCSRVALDLNRAAGNTLAVNAIGPGTCGPAATVPVFSAGWYPQPATGTGADTHWLNPAVTSEMTAHTINVGLPDIFPHKPTSLPIGKGDPFSLDVTPKDRTSPYAYTLTIAGDGLAWAFDGNAIREKLYASYQAFLYELETAAATARGVQTVQAAIARAMPQTFAETLLYAYGFTDDRGSVDLLSGMVLRAEYAAYQTLGQSASNQVYLNGFVPAAVAEYTISRTLQGANTFTALDSFIGWLVGQGATTVSAPKVDEGRQAGAGGLMDSGNQDMRQPFLRLVYPRTFLTDDSNNPGSPRPGENAMILAASSYGVLEEATTAVRHGGSGLPQGVGALYFRGRSTLTPQISVFLDGAPETVSLGTTVDGLLARRAMNPSAVALPLSGLKMWRGVQSALVGLPTVYPTSGSMPVCLTASAVGSTLTGLPLLGGDQLHLEKGDA